MTQFYQEDSYREGFRSYLNNVFATMAIGLIVTTAMAYFCFRSLITGGFMYKVYVGAPLLMILLAVAQIGVVISLSALINRISVNTARLLFFGYCILTGINFGTLPLVYGLGTVFEAFAYAAIMFVVCCIIGHTTQIDLSRFGGLLTAGLITLIIMSIASIFLGGNLIVGWLGLILFLGLTAFDMQMIKRNYEHLPYGDVMEKYGIISALNLYLDFINMFIHLLRILASNKNRR